MSSKKTVTLSNVGPITYLELPVPKDGGMVILKGRNGAGKTTALNAMNQAVTGSGRLNVRDGTDEAQVDCLGVHIRARKNTKYAGCLEVDSLAGKFSIADIIDPGFSDPVANDKRAVLGILQVVGAKADPSLFYDLVGGEENFRRFVTKDTLRETDLVSMGSKTKRNFADAARDLELDVVTWTEKLKAVEAALPEKTVGDGRSAEEVERDLQKARDESIEARADRRNSIQRIEEFEKHLAEFNQASANDPDSAVANAKAVLQAATEKMSDSAQAVADLRLLLQEAESQLAISKAECVAAEAACQAAESQLAWYRNVKSMVESGRPKEYPEEAVARVDAMVSQLQDELFSCRLLEKSRESEKEASDLRKKIGVAQSTAEALRAAAKSVDFVLTEMLEKVSDLKYEDERLFVLTDRGKTYFHDPSGTNGLSKGERTKLVIDIAAKAVGDGGIIVVDQDFTQDLDPVARKEVAEHARSRKVTIYTAVCTEDESLKAEVI